MVACNCSITHTNVHSMPFCKTKTLRFFYLFFLSLPLAPSLILDPIVNLGAAQPIERSLSDPGNSENNVIFINRDISSPPHYHSTVMNGIFCPTVMKGPVICLFSPNWLFTTFQHRQTGIFLIMLSLSFSLTPQSAANSLLQKCP